MKDDFYQLSFFDDSNNRNVEENEQFLTQQIITYIGNKRSLLDYIGQAVDFVRDELGKDKIDFADVFSGSGVVSRYAKQFANNLYVNDLEKYCNTINRCYLTNKDDVDFDYLKKCLIFIEKQIQTNWISDGFISRLYAPKDDRNIQEGERVFYTTRNAQYIDSARNALDLIEEPFKTYLLAPLLYSASVHTNTSGVFKGFYKNSATGIGQFGGDGHNALTRIMGNIKIDMPIFSNFNCHTEVFQMDANKLHMVLPNIDIAYIDPPYNQHPYGSNYFMLNLIDSYIEPKDVSRVSGIPKSWNKSNYNVKKLALPTLFDLCEKLPAKYLLISFNSEGFITHKEMISTMSQLGGVRILEKEYNAFRGSRNLFNREKHVQEYLFLVKKGGKI